MNKQYGELIMLVAITESKQEGFERRIRVH